MDKYEFNIKAEEIRKRVEEGDYKTAMKIADSIDWRRVRNANMLSSIADIYEQNKEYEEAKEILLLAYDRAPVGKRFLYRLAEVSVEAGEMNDAADFYRAFCQACPEDPRQYILRYMILKAKGAKPDQLIDVLEQYANNELDEKWLYELAVLYSKAGEQDLCVRTCDKITLLFGLGKYVDKAMELKLKYQPLTKQQMDLVEHRDEYEERLHKVEEEFRREDEAPENAAHTESKGSFAASLDYHTSGTGEKASLDNDQQAEIKDSAKNHDEEIGSQNRAVESAVFPSSANSSDGNVNDGQNEAGDLTSEDQLSSEGLRADSIDTGSMEIEDSGRNSEKADTSEKQGSEEPAQGIDQAAAATVFNTAAKAESYVEAADHLPSSENDVNEASASGAVNQAILSSAGNAVSADQKNETAPVVAVNRETSGSAVTSEPQNKETGAAVSDETAEDELNRRNERNMALPRNYHMLIEAETEDEAYKIALNEIRYYHTQFRLNYKIARIHAEKLNSQGLQPFIPKLAGRDFIIMDGGALSDSVIEEITEYLDHPKDFTSVILVGAKDSYDSLNSRHPEFIDRFEIVSGCEEKQPEKTVSAQEPTPEPVRVERPGIDYQEAKARRERELAELKDREEEERAERARKEGDAQREASEETYENAPEYEDSLSENRMKEQNTPENAKPDEGQEGSRDTKRELDIDSFVQHAESYAAQIDCALSGKSVQAIYECAERMQQDGEALTFESAEDLIEDAADRAEKPSLFHKQYDKDNRLILRPDHFLQ